MAPNSAIKNIFKQSLLCRECCGNSINQKWLSAAVDVAGAAIVVILSSLLLLVFVVPGFSPAVWRFSLRSQLIFFAALVGPAFRGGPLFCGVLRLAAAFPASTAKARSRQSPLPPQTRHPESAAGGRRISP